MKKLFSWWIFGFCAFWILFSVVLLRIINLDKFPIFVDEAIYVRWAQVMRAESTLRFLPMTDGKQPLFMWVIIPFLKVLENPLVAGRLVSVVTGIISLIGVGVLSYLLFKSKKAALVAFFVYAISPYSVFFDRMALADSMLSMFGIWTFIGGILIARTLRLDVAMLTGFALGGAWLTKSPALFFSLLFPTTWLFADWKKEKLKLSLRLLFFTGVSLLISQIMFNILRLGPNFQMLGSRNLDYVYPLNSIFSSPMDPLIPHLKDVVSWLKYFGPVLIILFLLGGLIIGLKKYFRQTLFLMTLVIVPTVAQCVYAKVFTARYMYFVFPYLAILVSLVFLVRSKVLKIFLSFLLFLYTFTALRQDLYLLFDPKKMSLPVGERSGYLEEWSSGYGIKEIAEYLRVRASNLPAGAQIIVGTDGYFGTLPDGLQIYLNDISAIKIFGAEVRFSSVPKSVVDSAMADNETYLVVNSSRFFIRNPENEGLTLIHSYPRAKKTNGDQESLLFFSVKKQ
jgi:4-amino-4-deoxy-L-arabinose transferase-like glycosyltransferase